MILYTYFYEIYNGVRSSHMLHKFNDILYKGSSYSIHADYGIGLVPYRWEFYMVRRAKSNDRHVSSYSLVKTS